MTLTEQLRDLDGIVKLGARNGSGFFFIGEASELRDNMAHYDELIDAYERNRIANVERLIELQQANFDRIQERGEDTAISGHYLDILKQRRDRWVKYLETAVPLHEREVHDVYSPHVYDEDTTVLIVDGDAYGGYWTSDEVKPGHPFKLMAANIGGHFKKRNRRNECA